MIERLAALICKADKEDHNSETQDKHYEFMADYLIANGITIQRWIAVSEKSPDLHTDDYEEPDGSRMQFEVSDPVWVMTESGSQTKAQYEYGPVFQGWVGEFGETIYVTHWMPLPQPPKEGE